MPATFAPSNGIAFIVAYTVVCDVIAKACSSPQTAEINASSRSETLMKWVNIGTIEAACVVAVAAYIDPQFRPAIIAGGLLAVIVTYGQYLHAKRAGLASDLPGTES